MKRALLILCISLVSITLTLVLVARIGMAFLVGSDEFRQEFNAALERALRSFLPTAMCDVKELALTEVASLEIHDLTIRSTKQLDASLAVARARVTPAFSSLLGTGPLKLDVDALIGGGGRIFLRLAVPKHLLVPQLGGGDEPLAVTGTMTQINAPSIAGLIFPESAGPNFQLSSGLLGGTFTLSKPLGTAGHGHKSGEVTMRLDASTWRIPGKEEKELALPPVEIMLELKDYVLRLRSPLIIKEASSRTMLNGALMMSPRADGVAHWDLEMSAEGDTRTSSRLARLFRCKEAVVAPHFRINGPVTIPVCG